MNPLGITALLAVAAVSASAAGYVPPRGGFDFPIYTNQPAGRQITSGQLPATTTALAPEETRRRTAVPTGFEVRLFAAEPMVVNPVAMTWDERGRLWVLELYEYPKGAPKGATPRDRIKVLEDSDADGKADKVHVWADGLNLATGLVLGNGGAYVGAAPNLLFLEDTNGDDKADKTTVLKTGFGLEDRHELLNGFAWGPDGWLYMTHGVFTHSNVKDPNDPEDDGVKMDAAVARYHPLTRKFEVFADGTSNPWGIDWDSRGEAFVSACVIQHLFHMAPGGQYNRQGGTWPNPYGYVQELPTRGLPAIVDWRHHRAAHSGICVYQGDQWPADWRGLIYLGNIHENAVNCDRTSPVGATYRAERESKLLGAHKGAFKLGGGNFFVSSDPWVRPVSIQSGPDGAMWVMDWYDKYPCYQNAQADPEGVDREHGRIWRVVWVGSEANKPVPTRRSRDLDLKRRSNDELVALLQDRDIWHQRQSQRLLRERMQKNAGDAPAMAAKLVALAKDGGADLSSRLAAIFSLSPEQLAAHLDVLANDSKPEIRIWAARFTGEAGQGNPAALARVEKLASDKDPAVRASAAVALRQFTSGSLTVNTPARSAAAGLDFTPQFAALLAGDVVPGDFYTPHIVWMAMEPLVASNPEPFLALLAAHDTPVSAYCTRRVMRRICDMTDAVARARHLDRAVTWLGENASRTTLAGAALDGLIEAQKSKGAAPSIPLEPVFVKLAGNAALADRAQRLAAAFGDKSAARLLIARINDASASVEDRLRGISAAREAKTDGAREELLKLLRTPLAALGGSAARLKSEAVIALSAFGYDASYTIVDTWKELPQATKTVAAETLVRGTKTARALLAGVQNGTVKAADISATARRALAQSEDSTIADSADRLLGKYRKTGADKLKLIAEKKAVVLSGTADLKNGHEVSKTTCFVCHKLHGEGADVGPDLTGVGRSTLDALLHNIIDPNEVIGNGYETTEVELKDETTITGRVVEETGTRIKLLASGPVEHTIAKSDIRVIDGKPAIRKLELSLMPEGLEQIPDKDFRDMVMFLLNPPQDNRPWTPALRKELLGIEEKKTAQNTSPADEFRGPGAAQHDGESVALWNPDWRVVCPPFEGAPRKLVDYAGQRNVLMTHPFSRTRPSSIERSIDIPQGKRTVLSFLVAADDKGDWTMRVLADGQSVHTALVNREGKRWKPVSIDLTPFAGRSVQLKLENAANDWNYEFGYWADLQVTSTTATASR